MCRPRRNRLMSQERFGFEAPRTRFLAATSNRRGPMMTVEIRGREVTFLVDTANDLRRVVEGLSEAQLRYRSNDDSWSIADILEHLAVVEHAFTHHVAPQ